MATSTRLWFTFMALATLSGGCVTNARTREGRIPGERRDCRAAAAQLAAGNAAAETFSTLAWCDETGPEAIAAVWRRSLPDTSLLGMFLFASGNLRDGRIFAAAFPTASDSRRPAAERAAGLLVLVAQLDSSVTVALIPAPKTERWRAGLARESHAAHVPGTNPLPANARARVTALAQALRKERATGTAGLRDLLSTAVRATELALQQLPRAKSQSRNVPRDR